MKKIKKQIQWWEHEDKIKKNDDSKNRINFEVHIFDDEHEKVNENIREEREILKNCSLVWLKRLWLGVNLEAEIKPKTKRKKTIWKSKRGRERGWGRDKEYSGCQERRWRRRRRRRRQPSSQKKCWSFFSLYFFPSHRKKT